MLAEPGMAITENVKNKMWSLFQMTADNLFINIFIAEPMQQILKFF